MKEVLVVINTLGHAGAEMALLELLRRFDPQICHVSLYVLTGQGELVHGLPSHVRLLNRRYRDCSVLSKEGRRGLFLQTLRAMFTRGAVFRCLPYLCRNFTDMVRKKRVLPDKLLWRILSDGGQRIKTQYDLAVAFLEGGSAYYVADHVKAARKAAFVHVDYGLAGYTRALDQDCWRQYDRIFAVSREVRDAFTAVYPEYGDKTEVFHNLIDRERICAMAMEEGGFADEFDGMRILTVGRLTAQKGLELSIDAMGLLKAAGVHARWYVLGEGDRRGFLEERIKKLGLEGDFLLPGPVDNPYVYMRQADLYVQASRFEGKSIAIQEAQILGMAVLVSDCSGNREQVTPDVDGMLCGLTPEQICAGVRTLLEDHEKRARLGAAAAEKARMLSDVSDISKLFSLL